MKRKQLSCSESLLLVANGRHGCFGLPKFRHRQCRSRRQLDAMNSILHHWAQPRPMKNLRRQIELNSGNLFKCMLARHIIFRCNLNFFRFISSIERNKNLKIASNAICVFSSLFVTIYLFFECELSLGLSSSVRIHQS